MKRSINRHVGLTTWPTIFRTSLSWVGLCWVMQSLLIVGVCSAQIKTLNGNLITSAALDQFLTRQLDSLGLPSLSIALIDKGKIVYHRTIGVTNLISPIPVDNQSIYEAASLSKPVFAYFVLRLVDQGVLTLDTPLYRYRSNPDLAYDERYKLITARMVLSHTSGLPNWRTSDLADSSRHIKAGTLYLKFQPGTQFSYSGEGYYYLAQVLAQLTKHTLRTLDPLFQEEVVKPLGLSYAWFSSNPFISQHKVTGHIQGHPVKRWPSSLPHQDSTWFGAAGGLHTESLSYAQFLIALMKGEGLSPASAAALFTSQVALPSDGDWDGDTGWGLGVAIRPTAYGTDYEHRGNNGNFQSYFRINKVQQSGYVFFVNCDQGASFNKRLATFFLRGQ